MSDLAKEVAARAAAHFVRKEEIIGVGSGTTVDYFLKELAALMGGYKQPLVVASAQTGALAKSLGFSTVSWRSAPSLSCYVDGTDWITERGFMLKGRGGAMLGEKIVSSLSSKFIVMFSEDKLLSSLTTQAIYCEVLPQASSIVARKCMNFGGRLHFLDRYTDSQNWLMELTHDEVWDYPLIASYLDEMPGIVAHGIFKNPADLGLIGYTNGEHAILKFKESLR